MIILRKDITRAKTYNSILNTKHEQCQLLRMYFRINVLFIISKVDSNTIFKYKKCLLNYYLYNEI